MATTISVSVETKQKLSHLGSKGQTYDEIINKAIELAERQLFFDEQRRILKEDDFVELSKI